MPFTKENPPALQGRVSVAFALSAFLGCGIGFLTAFYAVQSPVVLGGTAQTGYWGLRMGTAPFSEDPYQEANFITQGILPLNVRDVMEFSTYQDSRGNPLVGACTYVFEDIPLRGRWFSLWVRAPNHVDQALTSYQAVFEASGSLKISFSPNIQPGHWLKTSGLGKYSIVFRIYGPVLKGYHRLSFPFPKALDKIGCS